MKESKWKTIDDQIVYDNPWITVHHKNVITPAGNPGIYGLVAFKNIAVAALPLDQYLNTYLVGQFRYVLNEYSWEIPEGGCPTGETTLETAKRELLEETGLTAKNWTPILEMDISNSVSNERSVSYIATGLKMEQAQPEETEDLQLIKLPFRRVFQMVQTGQIRDSLSVATILKANYLIEQNEIAYQCL